MAAVRFVRIPANAIKGAGGKVDDATGRPCEHAHQAFTNTCISQTHHVKPGSVWKSVWKSGRALV